MSRELRDEFREALEAAVAAFGLGPLSEEQTDQLVKHYAMLCRWNQRINLTRIIDPQKAAELHYAESLFGARLIADARSILDIGTGAGFPAIPLAVARPNVHVTALEAKQKKSLFLREAKDELMLMNFEVKTARLEEIDLAAYELLTSRALDRAESILPSIIERMRSNQRVMLYCASDLFAMLEAKLRCKIETHLIPESEARFIAIFSKE